MNCFQRNRKSGFSKQTKTYALFLSALGVLASLASIATAQCAGEGGNSLGFDMAPETSQRVVEEAVKLIPTQMAPGPVKPD